MTYRRYPSIDRARKHAVLHGKRMVVVNLAPFVAAGDFPPDDGRVRQLVDSLPSGTMQFSAWFPTPERPVGGEETNR
jgi:hypothetical protein